MPCWKRLRSAALGLALAGLAWVAALWSGAAVAAGGIEVRQFALNPADDGYEVAADFAVEFPPVLDEAVARGVTLFFVAEFELTRPRWYWLDERAARQTQTWRLSYHALTRQYRLASGALHQNFNTLSDALRVLSRVRGWSVVAHKDLKPGETYQAALRLYLDVSQLPKPFQLNALANREWDLGSAWKQIPFTPSAPAPASPPAAAPAAEAK